MSVVVIFDTGIAGDRRHNFSPAQTAANEAAIIRGIRTHGAVAIKAPYGHPGRAEYPKQGDGEHFSAAGHRMIAARLVPKVIAAIGRQSSPFDHAGFRDFRSATLPLS